MTVNRSSNREGSNRSNDDEEEEGVGKPAREGGCYKLRGRGLYTLKTGGDNLQLAVSFLHELGAQGGLTACQLLLGPLGYGQPPPLLHATCMLQSKFCFTYRVVVMTA